VRAFSSSEILVCIGLVIGIGRELCTIIIDNRMAEPKAPLEVCIDLFELVLTFLLFRHEHSTPNLCD
jgi:hypothetical protein